MLPQALDLRSRLRWLETGIATCFRGMHDRSFTRKVSNASRVRIVARTMTPERVVRVLTGAVLLGFAAVFASPVSVFAAGLRYGAAAPFGTGVGDYAAASSPITLRVSAGYQNIYRGATWAPVRVIVRNGGSADVSGILEIPQAGQSASVGAQPAFHGLYRVPVVVPAGGTRTVTLYVPGLGVQGQVNVSFRDGNTTLAAASASPIGVDTSALLIGVLASTPADMAWVAPAIQQQVTTHVIRLSPATIDPVPEALATFDLIVLTNADTSQLDRAQLVALERYVRNGGSLLVVGGPTWQETLRPLQAALLPGHLSGLRVLPDLHGLLPLVPTSRPVGSGPAAVSVLSQPSGTILASQAGIPLVVRTREGQGAVEYLAFDPSLSSIQRWSSAPHLLEHLVAMAAPFAITRTWVPGGFRARFQTVFRSEALTNELSNLPATTVPFLALFAALTFGYVLILGPANFLLLRWIRRQHLAWLTIPILALSYLGSILGIASHIRASSAVLNTIGLVTLDGGAGLHPATLYVGLATPQAGDYHLTYSGAALPAPLPQLNSANGFSFRSASTLHATPLGMRLQEVPQTAVTFLSMRRWTMRDLTLEASVNIPGVVQSGLTIDAQGNVAGPIQNGTNLDLLEPVIVAGQTVTHLSDIPAGGSVYAHVHPSIDSFGQGGGSFWAQLYGGPNLGNPGDFGGFGDCCSQFSYSHETQLLDRIRNVVAMLSQARPDALSRLGEVVLIGWSERPLGTVRVDGSVPQRRDLNLVVTPLSVRFPSHGSFRLLTGTLGPHLVDILPRAPQSSCCGFGRGSEQPQEASVAPGGFLTFEFDLRKSGHVRFQRLTVNVSGGDDGANSGRVYDWRALRWVNVDLSSGVAQLPNPNRFVSLRGQIMVRLQATGGAGDLRIFDPYHDIQISGVGAVT
jgi:hypothetical protein